MTNASLEEELQTTTIEIAPGHRIVSAQDEDMVPVGGFVPTRIQHAEIDSLEAARLLDEWNKMPGQRKIDEKRVLEYIDRIDQGLWYGCEVAIAQMVDEHGNPVPDPNEPTRQTFYLLNGQHSLTAIAQKQARTKVVFKFFEVTLRQLELLYAQFDDNKPKSGKVGLEPLAQFFGNRPPNKRGVQKPMVPSRIIDLVGRSVFWVDFRGMRAKCERPPNHRIIGIIRDRESFIHWLLNLHEDPSNPFGKETNWFWRQGVVAAAYKCWSGDIELATNFWMRVLRPYDIDEDQVNVPEMFRDILVAYPKNRDWGKKPQSRLLKASEMAWNLWIENPDPDSGVSPHISNSRLDKLQPSYIENLGIGALEYLHFEEIDKEEVSAIGSEVEKPEGTITKTGKMTKD